MFAPVTFSEFLRNMLIFLNRNNRRQYIIILVGICIWIRIKFCHYVGIFDRIFEVRNRIRINWFNFNQPWFTSCCNFVHHLPESKKSLGDLKLDRLECQIYAICRDCSWKHCQLVYWNCLLTVLVLWFWGKIPVQ